MSTLEALMPLVRSMPMVRGRWRVHEFVNARLPGSGIHGARIFGYRMDLELGDLIQRHIYTGTYEPEESHAVKDHLRPGMTFVDVGANVGYFSALAASRGARVIAFEPSPYAYEKLTAWSQGRIDARNLALGDKPGEATLWIPPESQHNHDPSFYAYSSGMRPEPVRVDTLDRQLCDVPSVDLLKIDAEGHELRIFAGAKEVLRRTKAVMCEFNPRLLAMAGTDAVSLWRTLRDAGFRDPAGVAPDTFETRLLMR